MTMIRPETEMKDSGVEWIGDIPTNWRRSKLKYLGEYINGYAFKPSDWSSKGHQIIRIQDLTGSNSGEPNYFDGILDEKYRVVNGDILVSWAATLDAFVWKKEDGWLNQHIFKAVPNEKIVKGYFLWLLKIAMDNMNNDDKHGIVMQHVTIGLFNNYVVPLAPYTEQQAIADYLDETCSKIDEIIAEAKASINEYKKLKQSVIFEAVTKGLDKNVEMKECSVNWLDEIPSTWELIRLKYILTEINNRSETGTEQPLSVSQVMGVVPSYMISVANPTASYVGQKIVESNDIVFNKLKAHLGVFFMSKYHGLVSPDYAVYRTNDKVIPKYLEYLFHTSACISELKKYISGVAEGLMRLYTSDLFNIRICLPKVDEQIKIVEYVDNNVGLFDSLITEKESLINNLEAYKKSLIYEVVTGKRRVV